MITKEIKKLDDEATKLVVYYRGRGDLRDEIIGIEILAEDGSVKNWIGETEASCNLKCDVTIELERVL